MRGSLLARWAPATIYAIRQWLALRPFASQDPAGRPGDMRAALDGLILTCCVAQLRDAQLNLVLTYLVLRRQLHRLVHCVLQNPVADLLENS